MVLGEAIRDSALAMRDSAKGANEEEEGRKKKEVICKLVVPCENSTSHACLHRCWVSFCVEIFTGILRLAV